MTKITHFIVHSKVATAIAALLCIGVWIYAIVESGNGGVLSYLNLLLYVIFGMLIGSANERAATGSQRTTLHTTLYYMGCAINPQLAVWQESTICLMLMVAAYRIMATTYRGRTAMGSYFAAFALVGIASIYSPQLLYLVPVLILCCGFMQSLHARTAIAALLGVLVPYWVAFSILYLTDNTHQVQSFVERLTAGVSYAPAALHVPIGKGDTLAIPMIAIQWVWALMLAIPAIIRHTLSGTSKVKTRAIQNMQIGHMGTLFVGMLILPSLYTTMQPVLITLTATIGYGFFVSENKSRGRNIWLITLFVIWLLILGLNVWNSFSTY